MDDALRDFSLPSALVGQLALFALFALVVYAFAREAARVVIRVLLIVGVVVAIALVAGWLDQSTLGRLLEQVGEWLLTGLEAVVGWLGKAWARISSTNGGNTT
jgi:hypothetical protein